MVRLFSPYHSVKVVTVVCFHSYSVLQLYMFLFKLFAETQKVAISFVRSVCVSVRIEQLGSNWTDFFFNLIFEYFSKNVFT